MIRSSAHLSSSAACYRDACLSLEPGVLVEPSEAALDRAVEAVFRRISSGCGHVGRSLPEVARERLIPEWRLRAAYNKAINEFVDAGGY